MSQQVKGGKGKGGKGKKNKFRLRNTRMRGRKTVEERLKEALKPTEGDITKMLAAQVHVGRRTSHVNMNRYIWKRRKDGFHIIHLQKTWNKIQLAARIIVTVKNPADVMVISTRTYGQRGAIKYSTYTGASTQLGKWVAGTLCNPQNKAFREPRLLIVDDPNTCFAALKETSYVGVPVIAFCGIHQNTRFVDCAIPCNNRGRLSVGLMFWLLAREVLRMRGEIKRTEKWGASVDLFFYRDPDEIAKDQENKKKKEQEESRQELAPNEYQQEYPEEMGDGQQIAEWDAVPINQLEDWGNQAQVPMPSGQEYTEEYVQPTDVNYPQQPQVPPQQIQQVPQQMYEEQPTEQYEQQPQPQQFTQW